MQQNVFEGKSLFSVYAKTALPVVFSMVITLIYNVADTYFVSVTQDTVLVAAVSLCAPVFMILMAFGNIFGQGGTSVIARLFGKGDAGSAKSVSSFCFWASVLVGLVVGGIMLLFRDPLLGVLGADATTYTHARDYFVTLAIGSPFIVANFIHCNLLRAEGKATASMVGSVGGSVVNLFLDPILILGLHMGALGAALATVLGYVLADIFYLIIVLRRSAILSVAPSIVKIPAGQAMEVFLIGISTAVTNWLQSLCQVVTNRLLLPYGAGSIAAMGIALKAMSIGSLVLIGMCFGAAPAIGYYYGGGSRARLRSLLKVVFTSVTVVGLVLTVVLFSLARPITGIFLHDAAIVTAGTAMLRWQVITMLLGGYVTLITICFQAGGRTWEALLASVTRQGFVFLAAAMLLSRAFGYTGILASQAVSDVVSMVMLFFLFLLRFYGSLREEDKPAGMEH